jgi:hypothetical protein
MSDEPAVMSEVDLKAQVAKLAEKVESFAKEHGEFHSVHVSRRGVEGPRGLQGEPGPAGQTGAPGKDADPAQVAEIVKKALKYDVQATTREFERLLKDLEFEFGAAKAALRWAVIEELKAAGVIDSEGEAILKPGPAGKDSTVAGPKGDAGLAGRDGFAGRDGRDATIQIGSVITGETASVSLREKDGVQILDFVLPRGEKGPEGPQGPQGQGQRGEQGPEGLQGIPGQGLSKDEVIELILDLKRRKTI